MKSYVFVHQQFERARARGRLEDRFDLWRVRHPSLRRFKNLGDLIACCRGDSEPDYDAVNPALIALCEEAQRGDDEAVLLLLWLFAGSLSEQTHSLRPVGNALGREDLDAEALAGLWQAVTWMRPDSTYVAHALLRQARLRAVRALLKAATENEDGVEVPLDLDEVESMAVVEDASVALARDLLDAALADGVLNEAEAALLLDSSRRSLRVLGSDTATDDAVRQHRTRLYRRLRVWLQQNAAKV